MHAIPHLLTLVIFLPLACGLLLLALARNQRAMKTGSLVASIVTFALSLGLWICYNPADPAFQFADRALWIPALQAGYAVGIDGISLLLILLTTFLTPLALLSSWNSITKQLPLYLVLMLLLETGMLGVFAAMDTVLFYVFWEVILIPMYFIIGVWGGARRIYAALKFFIFTMVGSLCMLVAIIWLGYAAGGAGGHFVSGIPRLIELGPQLPAQLQMWLFAAFALSFLIKVPAFPLHTWLPDAHVEAPTAGSVILAGVLLKMGTYGLIRFNVQVFPQSAVAAAPLLAVLGVVGIVYGALVSMVQQDVKKLVAYSSVSHMGFVLLGIFGLTVEGMQGAVLQMVNHGLSTGALFLIVGMLYERRHTRMIDDFGGLARIIPVCSTLFLIVSLSSIGLPGLNGFVGELLILLGTFRSATLGSGWFTAVAATGVVLSAVYMLWMLQRVIFGVSRREENASMRDLSARELGLLLPILLFIVWIGVYPGSFLARSEQTVQRIVRSARAVPGMIATPAPSHQDHP